MKKEYEKLEAAVRKFGRDYITELANQLILADKRATGHLIKSLDYEVVEALNSLMFIIKAPMYLNVIDKGRRAGAKQPPTSPIKAWIDVRGIKPGGGKKDKQITKDGLAFAIARSIGIKGIKGIGVLAKTRKKLMDQKSQLLAKAAAEDIKAQITSTLSATNS